MSGDSRYAFLDDELPSRAELTSADKRTYDRAWEQAYPILWRRGMGLAKMKLGNAHDQEDIVARAIEQFRLALLRGVENEVSLEAFISNETAESGD